MESTWEGGSILPNLSADRPHVCSWFRGSASAPGAPTLSFLPSPTPSPGFRHLPFKRTPFTLTHPGVSGGYLIPGLPTERRGCALLVQGTRKNEVEGEGCGGTLEDPS